MVKLSTTITVHPSRVDWAEQMWNELGGDPVRVLVDANRDGAWPTYRKALLDAPIDATHHLILQDDLALSRDMLAGVVNAIKAAPMDSPLSFFCLWDRAVEDAKADGCSWLSYSGAYYAQAWCWPVTMIAPMLIWLDDHLRPDLPSRHADVRAALYTSINRIPVLHSVPSLVDHAGYDRSVVGWESKIYGRDRIAAYWWGDRSALDIQWNRKIHRTKRQSSMAKIEGLEYWREWFRPGMFPEGK